MNAVSETIWTAKEAAQATGGRYAKDWAATSLSIDSRTIREGALFVAIRGEHSDGHDYVRDALEKGAAAAVVDHIPDNVAGDAPLLIVKDTMTALQDLGQAARNRCGGRMIAVTGSVGKTGTKELLAAALGAQGQIHASRASYNNHWGVPYTLAAMHEGTDFGVFEIGMNHSGEITPLARQVRPDIALVTIIAPVHIENFESEKQIARAKAEIFDGMREGGVAILNRDNPWYDLLAGAAHAKGLVVKSFGEHSDADARLKSCLLASNGSRIEAVIDGEEIGFTLQFSGKHIAMNALAVLMAVKCAGADMRKAVKAMGAVEPLAGRGKRDYLDIGDKNNPVTLIDESYNASPVAMNAAFKVLALIDPGRGGRRIAVLGDMYELGQNAAQLHAELALPLEAADVQLVYTCGPLMKNLYDRLPESKRGAHSDNSVELAQIVPEVLVPGDVVMVKGSRGGGAKPRMQVIVEALRALPFTKK